MQFSKTTFIKLFVTLGYAFVGYFHRFGRRTCHTICKFIKIDRIFPVTYKVIGEYFFFEKMSR